jgi:integrase
MEPGVSIRWQESKAYQNWILGVERGKRGSMSQNMRSGYDAAIKQFLQFVNSKENLDNTITPDDLIEEANRLSNEDQGSYKLLGILYDFEKWLQGITVEGYKTREFGLREKPSQPVTANHKAFGIIRGFYSHNKIWLPSEERKPFVSKTRKNDENHEVFMPDDNEQITPDWDEFRFFMSNLKFRDQVIVLSLVSTSQDIGDLLELKIDFVLGQDKRRRLFWEGERNKTKYPFRTFFSQEATSWVRRYIEQERKGANPDELIFVTPPSLTHPKGNFVRPSHVSENFRLATANMGIKVIDEVQNPFRPKRMRSIFSTACFTAGIDDDVRHTFMGHKKDISQQYRNMPWQTLESIYAKVEPLITVYGDISTEEAKIVSKQALSKVVDIEIQNQKLMKELETMRQELGSVKTYQERLQNLYKIPLNPEVEQTLDALVTQMDYLPLEQRRQQMKLLLSTWAKLFATTNS